MAETQDYFQAMLMQSLLQATMAGIGQTATGLSDLALSFIMRAINDNKSAKQDRQEEEQNRIRAERERARLEQERDEQRKAQERLMFDKKQKDAFVRAMGKFVDFNNKSGKGKMLTLDQTSQDIINSQGLDKDQSAAIKSALKREGLNPKNTLEFQGNTTDMSKIYDYLEKNGTSTISPELLSNFPKQLFDELTAVQKNKILTAIAINKQEFKASDIDLILQGLKETSPEPAKVNKKNELFNIFKTILDDNSNKDREKPTINLDADQTMKMFELYKKEALKSFKSNIFKNLYVDNKDKTKTDENFNEMQYKYLLTKYNRNVLAPMAAFTKEAEIDFLKEINKAYSEFKVKHPEITKSEFIRDESEGTKRVGQILHSFKMKAKDMSDTLMHKYDSEIQNDIKKFSDPTKRDIKFVDRVLEVFYPGTKELTKVTENQLAHEFKTILENSNGDLGSLAEDLASHLAFKTDVPNVKFKTIDDKDKILTKNQNESQKYLNLREGKLPRVENLESNYNVPLSRDKLTNGLEDFDNRLKHMQGVFQNLGSAFKYPNGNKNGHKQDVFAYSSRALAPHHYKNTDFSLALSTLGELLDKNQSNNEISRNINVIEKILKQSEDKYQNSKASGKAVRNFAEIDNHMFYVSSAKNEKDPTQPNFVPVAFNKTYDQDEMQNYFTRKAELEEIEKNEKEKKANSKKFSSWFTTSKPNIQKQLKEVNKENKKLALENENQIKLKEAMTLNSEIKQNLNKKSQQDSMLVQKFIPAHKANLGLK